MVVTYQSLVLEKFIMMCGQAGSDSGPTNVTFKFKEVVKSAADKASVWHYFLREEKGQYAKCNDSNCNKILKHGGSTTPLHNHLRSKHSIELKQKPNNEEAPTASTSAAAAPGK